MKHKTLDVLIKAENIMGVYRNYSFQINDRKTQITRVVLEILITAVILLNCSYEAFSGQAYLMRRHVVFILRYARFFSTITLMICAIQSSRSYKIFVQNLMAVHQCFNTGPTKKCSRKLKNFFITATVVFSFCGACLFFLRILNKVYVENSSLSVSLVLLYVTEMCFEIRFSMEHVIFYIYISIVHCLLRCLNDYVSELQKYYDDQEKKESVTRKERNDHLTEEQMEEWATNYMLLVGCSKELSACFSFQMKFSLALSSMNYIFSVYKMFYCFIVKESNKYFGIFISIFILIYCLCGTYLVVPAGQKLINEAAKTRRGLLKINNKLSIYHTSKTKAVKNLCLLVKANPIKIEYTGRVVQGMYLIPIVLSLSISYIIVALQFGHLI